MSCAHKTQIKADIQPKTEGCEECMQAGTWWVRLRLCLVCGHVGCCETSPNSHARKHWQETGHPIMQSHEPRQAQMRWCYEDEMPV